MKSGKKAALLILERARPSSKEEEGDRDPDRGADEGLAQDLMDAISEKEPMAVYEAICAIIEHHSSKQEDDES